MSKTLNIETLKFPIGEFKMPTEVDSLIIKKWINEIEVFPTNLETELKGLTKEILKWKYRPGGWNIAQVVHHCADSHMNSFIRFKLALTEDNPAIKPYMETSWAELPDATETPVNWSIDILKPLHNRWVFLLNKISSNELQKTFVNPEHGRDIILKEAIATYAWHGKHHLAHIKQAMGSNGSYN